MSGECTSLLRELRDRLSRTYGVRLRGLYLYGSYARGDFDAESDVDVLVVLADFGSYGAEVDRTAADVSDLALAFGVSISVVFARARDWLSGDSPFLRNARAEAVAA